MERVLICIIGSTRAHRLTFPGFKRQVIDQLNGDLALALCINENYDYSNPFWQHAKYRWTAPVFDDMGEAFDLAQNWLCQQNSLRPADWRVMLRLKGLWQGKIRSSDPQPSVASIATFCRWLLLHGMQQDDLLDGYDRFVITRSDFAWLCPHPPLSILEPSAIWIPDGEHYDGINDRHAIVSRTDVSDFLNIVSDIALHPHELYEEMNHQPTWNPEQFLAHHLMRKGLLQKVKHFPYVMYAAREVGDETATWSRGIYESAVGHYVKYPQEFRSATAYATIVRDRADWENRAWMEFDPGSVPSRQISFPRRLRNVCERIFIETVLPLKRPPRVGRLVRFSKQMVRRAVRLLQASLRRGMSIVLSLHWRKVSL